MLALLVFTSGLFLYTVHIRKPWRGVLSEEHHQWVTGSALKFTHNWYAEDPVSLKFAMLELPKSVESPTIAERDTYMSYPPGLVVPIYVLSEVTGHPPTASLVMKYNLLNHFLIAFVLGMLAYLIARTLKVSRITSLIFAVIPVLLELLLPGPLYFHQNIYFSDTAVILPVCLLILVEVLEWHPRRPLSPRALQWARAGLLFVGTLIDWQFVFLAVGLYLFRLAAGRLGKDLKTMVQRSLGFGVPVAGALALFLMQVAALHSFNKLLERYFLRTGSECYTAGPGFSFGFTYWQQYFPSAFGDLATGVMWASLGLFVVGSGVLAVRAVRRRAVSSPMVYLFGLMGLLVAVPFLRIYTLRCHSLLHDFTTIFFSPAIALVPFVVIPLLLINLEAGRPDREHFRRPWIPLALAALALIYVLAVHPGYEALFPQPNRHYAAVGNFLQTHTGYRDVVFSPDYEIASKPPQGLAYSHKRVYHINGLEDIRRARVKGDYQIKVFVNDVSAPHAEYLDELRAMATNATQQDGMLLFDVDQKRLRNP
jgi:hypothetical protein